ncbi:putative ATP-dependent RNA helicase SoYb [Anopheles maculipalpis]|uniref:putative ATP-dependent RNA helicase SoYb n=1 Tax=Anopheles maculipalpis TaxID=1496333 RepID=UPI0021595A10|nr:putative ATP-dependent RNA helicase SoYb [Anopheles maculipalpis]
MENQIFITCFVDPHKFWYKPFHPGSQKKQSKKLEDAIDEYCEQHHASEKKKHYELNELVGYYIPSLTRWTRCIVKGIREDHTGHATYHLWMIDEGKPEAASDTQRMTPLPEKFQDTSNTLVQRGLIRNVLPASCVYDPIGDQIRKAECLRWNESANKMIGSLKDGIDKVCFTNVTSYKIGKNTIDFGDLLFHSKSKTFNVANVLSDQYMGITVDSEYFLAYMFENQTVGSSRASSIVNGSLDDSVAYDVNVKLRKLSIISDGLNEFSFDESASMVGGERKQPFPPAPPAPPASAANGSIVSAAGSQKGDGSSLSSETRKKGLSHLNKKIRYQMAQKMKNASAQSGNTKSSSSASTKSNSLVATESPKAAAEELSTQLVKDNSLDQIRLSPNSLTIDVAQSIEAEYELMLTNKNVPKEQVPSPEPTTTKSGSESAQKFLQKIAKAKARLSQPKPTIPATEEQPKISPAMVPATIPFANLLPSEKLPTVESNAALKRFEKVIQNEKCLFSRRSHHRVLVHGTKLPHPIDRIEAANFSPRVHQNLEQLGITKLLRLQAYAWPHILRDNSFICVNGANTGKTFAYLPAVCSIVQRQIEESLVPSDAGPVAIIVCYSSREVQRIAYYCRKLLNSAAHADLAVLECYGIRTVTKICNLLFNGCAILVTTAPAYRRLYESAPEAFVRKRIQTVVIDNIEEMWANFAAELRLVCKNCDKEGLQMIVTASCWISVLGLFLQRYHNMIICIGAFLEAAVYTKADFRFRLFAGEQQKELELLRQLRQHDYRNERTIVFGKDSGDLVPIVNTLKHASINHIVCNERTVLQQHAGFRNWDEQLPGDMVVFVCSDELLGDLKITKAQHIVHYSLPPTWSTFTRRYACSFEYYESPYLASEGKQPKGKPSSLVLLNENNNQELPRLVDFLEQHLPKVPEKLIKYAKQIRSIHESAKIADGRAVSMICTHVLGLAVCHNIRNCVFRHTLTPDDVAPDALPRNGIIRLKICHVFSPAHYAVWLEAHQPVGSSDWTMLTDSRQYLVQDIAMQAYYANEDRHQMHGTPRRNELCAVYHEQYYWRCRIINYDESNVDSCDVQLQLIDTGRMVHVKSFALLHLPDQFRKLPGQAINVRIAALVPHDYEQDWDKTVTLTVRQWIEEHENRANCYVKSNVLLALKDTLWVDDLHLSEQLDYVKTTVTTKRVGATIISKQYGIGDRKTFEQIRTIVDDCEKLAMQMVQLQAETVNEGKLDDVEEDQISSDQERTFFLNETNVSSKENDREESILDENSKNGSTLERKVPTIEEENFKTVSKLDDKLVEREPDVVSKSSCLVPAELNTTTSSSSSFEELSLQHDCEQYRFDTFLVHKAYNVMIGHYLAPDNFYVYRCDRISEVDSAIKEFIQDESKLKPLENPQLHQHCLVFYENNYHRARVVKLPQDDSSNELEVFLLDFGGTFKSNRLYKISNRLLRELPFLAIRGSFAHIHPPNGDTKWSDEVSDAIYDKWLEQHNHGTMFASVTRVIPWGAGPDRIEGCNWYEMVLADGNASDEFSIISDIVYDNLALLQKTECDYDDEGTSTVADTEDDDYMQVNFTHEELMNMMKEITASRTEDNQVKAIREPARIVEVSGEEIDKELASVVVPKPSEKQQENSVVEKEPKQHPKKDRKLHLVPLICDYRYPQTVWDQDKYFVVLRVSAPDVERYDLVVKHTSLLLQFVKADTDERYIVPLNLFSAIDPRHTVHEIRGLSIVVRLRKLVPCMRWPKLHNHHGRKLPWIKVAANSNGHDSDASMDETTKKNRWNSLVQAHLDSSVESSQSGNERDVDSDLEDEEAVFLDMS